MNAILDPESSLAPQRKLFPTAPSPDPLTVRLTVIKKAGQPVAESFPVLQAAIQEARELTQHQPRPRLEARLEGEQPAPYDKD